MSVNCAPAIVAWGKYLVAHASQVHYTEGDQRMTDVHHPGGLPMESDCSSTCTCEFAWAGAPDPNGMNYDGVGNTDTMVEHGKLVPLAQVQAGNTLVIYFNGQGFTPADSEHVALVIEAGPDPLTISHGRDPIGLCRVSQDGRPHQFYRFDTMGAVAHYPPGATPPVSQRLIPGMTWAPNSPATKGDWLCYQGRRAGIPGPADLAAVKAHAIPQKNLTPAQLAALAVVRWGSL